MFLISGDVGLYGEKLAVALGFTTLVSALATFMSCRSCVSLISRLGLKNPANSRWYRPFSRYHGYYWWIFLFALTLHLLTAVMHTKIPVVGDPDAQIHWVILSFAVSSLAFVGVVLSSCRNTVSLLGLFTEKGLLSNHRFQSFYRYHSYYWLILALSITGHIIGSYAHIGVWPG